MKTLNLKAAVALTGLIMVTAACSKPSSFESSTELSSSGQVNCKASAGPIDPESLKIQSETIAQAGDPITYNLNQEVGCNAAESVKWQADAAQVLTQAGSKMTSTFNNPGTYMVSAKVANSSTGTSTVVAQKTVVVGSSPVISGPQIGMVGAALTFEVALPTGFVPASIVWDFGDRSATKSSLAAVSHTYNLAGLITIRAAVTDQSGVVTNLSAQVNIVDFFDGASCVTDTAITSPATGYVGQPVSLSLFVPTCLKNSFTSIQWTYGDTGTGSGQSVSHTYSQVGTYTITVRVYAPFVPPNTPWLTLTQTIQIVEAPPQPSPTPTPVPTPMPTPGPGATPTPPPTATPIPTPTPTPVPHMCPTAGDRRQTSGDPYTNTVSCGLDGTKTQTFKNIVTEECQVKDGVRVWVEISTTPALQSESACMGQSCTLPDGSKLANGASRTMYPASTPAGACSETAQVRTCNNGVLSGSDLNHIMSCRSGCGTFGPDGTVKIGVVTGEISVPLTCSFGEEGFFSIYNQIADQTCSDGQIMTSNTRQGDVKTAGSCPVYGWVSTETWTACSADCGGQQSRIYECRDGAGAAAPVERCTDAKPVETRVCDGNPDAVRRSEVAVTQEDGGSTATCPQNQIGVVARQRDVTTTTTYACIDHAVAQESQQVTYGAWVTESYCRDYVAHRCSQDSLSTGEAYARYQWMVKCQDKVPQIKDFLTEFADVKIGGYSISDTQRLLYPTFMDHGHNPERPWIAPKVPGVNYECKVPSTAYVAAVCLSSCATPEMEILAQAKANLQLRYVPFIDALTQNLGFVATLQSNSSMSSKTVVKTKVSQWVTELVDTEHDIIEFRMRSGRVLRLTPNHPVLSEQGMMKSAGDFKVGESLVMLGGQLDPIESLTSTKYFGKVYNVLVNSAAMQKNVVVTNGYLNGTAYFQNEGAKDMNRAVFRDRLIRGAFKK